jgi:hypothetical protein
MDRTGNRQAARINPVSFYESNEDKEEASLATRVRVSGEFVSHLASVTI